MENYSIYLPNYSIGPDIYKKVPKICSSYGHTAVVIGGIQAIHAMKDELLLALDSSDLDILDFICYGNEATFENVERLMSHPCVIKADMIFATGGGKALDTAKVVSVKSNKPLFTFPTIASNCSCCTSVSIMYHKDGSFSQPFFFERPAIHAFIHTGILANAPDCYLWAGMGDTYAKYYECTVSTRNDELEHFNALGVSMSRMCVDPILAYGEKALKDNRLHQTSYELEQVILAIQVTTALVSILVTTEHTVDNNSGLAHAIFYALTTIPTIEQNHLHGEIVGFGVLILLLLDNQLKEYETLYQFHKKIGLPVHISELDLTKEQLYTLLSTIVSMPDIRHNAYPITKEALWEAFEKNEKKC